MQQPNKSHFIQGRLSASRPRGYPQGSRSTTTTIESFSISSVDVKRNVKLNVCLVETLKSSLLCVYLAETKMQILLTLFTGLPGSIPKITSVSYAILLFLVEVTYVSVNVDK